MTLHYGPRRGNILFVAALETQFLVQLRVANLLRRAGKYHAVFYLDHPLTYRLKRMIAECKNHNIEYYISPSTTEPQASFFLQLIPGALKYILYYLRLYRQQVHEARGILRKVRPELIVLGEDGVDGNNAMVVNARKMGIPSLILPYEYSTLAQQLAAVRSDPNYERSYGRSSIINVLTGWLYPYWIFNDHGTNLLRHPGPRVIAQELLGIAPKLPWTVHGGKANVLAAENTVMFEHYRREGIPRNKMVLTGTVFDDVLADTLSKKVERKRQLYQQYHLSSDKMLLLCAIPTDQTRLSSNRYSTFHELLKQWIKAALRQNKFHVLFNTHPSISESDKDFIRSLGVTLASDDIATLVPVTDIFVTSVSSIIRWAIACGVPTLNYDVYQWRFHDYDSAPGVRTMDTQKEFERQLHLLTSDPAELHRIRQQQEHAASLWGMLDGKSGQRILDLLEKLLSNHNVRV